MKEKKRCRGLWAVLTASLLCLLLSGCGSAGEQEGRASSAGPAAVAASNRTSCVEEASAAEKGSAAEEAAPEEPAEAASGQEQDRSLTPASAAPEESSAEEFPAAEPDTGAERDDAAEAGDETDAAAAESPAVSPCSSLRELLPAGPKVLLDGVELESLSWNGITYVQDTAVMECCAWLTRDAWQTPVLYTNRSYDLFTLNWTTVYDALPEAAPEDGGILFTGCGSGEAAEYWLPVRELFEVQGMEVLWDGEYSTVYVTTPVTVSTAATVSSVPVLMYHEVGDDLWGISSLFVSPGEMREQLQYLADNGYDPIFFSDLSHLEDYDKPVLLTFDDGYSGNYYELYPLLREFGMKANVFVITGMIGDENYMTEEQVRELSSSGLVEIQSHTVDHYDLPELDEAGQRYQLEQSRLTLARITGKVPTVLSYPEGQHDSTTLRIAPEYYSMAIIMNGNRWSLGSTLFEIPRYFVPRGLSISDFAAKLY